jgi:TolA-binding protein
MLQRQLADVKKVNESLKQQIDKLQQDNRIATARAAECETQLAELREKPAAPPVNPSPAPKITDANAAYQQALVLFRQKRYDEAASTFQSILDAGNSGIEDRCHYWLGECSYGMKKYQEAVGHLEKVFGYQRSTKKDDAQMMIGNCYSANGNKVKAKEEYQKLIDKYPASPYVKQAKAKMGRLK